MARILIVDDEESIRYTFASFLSDDGHAVDTASRYDEALGKISAADYDLVFMDILLGGRSGIELLQSMRDRDNHCPVVMITGYPNAETASSAVRLGAFDYIFKPVRPEALLNTARKALQFKALQDENEQYRSNLEAIFRSVKDAIITVDTTLNVLEVNESALRICGLTREAIGTRLSHFQNSCSSRCIDALRETIEQKKSREISRIECERSGHPGQVVTISTSPLVDSSGLFRGAVMVIHDDTRLNELERNLVERRQFHHIIGQNREMQKLYTLIEDLADVQTTVLISGESGTGKELVAEAIHYKGKRGTKPLVKVNCSALSENLLESELFGHVKGAFTGADRDKAGRFQKADEGTLFLDEIGDLSPRMQLRLLRVLQEKEFERVGDSSPVKVDVRVITATNQDLSRKVKEGEFREDLYYRLKVVELTLPPLRERRDDIILLTDYFIQKFNARFDKNVTSISEDVKQLFLNYGWPGNIRELEHTLEHAFVVARHDTITQDTLPRGFAGDFPGQPVRQQQEDGSITRQRLIDALNKAGWNKSKAARQLGVNVRTVYRKIEKFDIQEQAE